MAQGMRAAGRNSRRFSHAVLGLFIGAIMCMAMLSMFRSDSRTLDGDIAAIQEQIAACEKEYRQLEREAAGMMSPGAVHAYAMTQLGMTQVHLAGAIRVDGIGRSSSTATAQLIRSVAQSSN